LHPKPKKRFLEGKLQSAREKWLMRGKEEEEEEEEEKPT
jgi:hypothetical protein